MPLVPASRARLLAPVLALLVAACGSDNPSGVDDPSLSTAERAGVATGRTGGAGAPSATRASACNGTLGAVTVEQVSVPAGASCTLDGTRVRGDVRVARDGNLLAIGARIDGNVQAEDARRVAITANTFVDGDVQATRRAAVTALDSEIDGNLQLEEDGTSLVAANLRIGGDLQVTKAASASIRTTLVRGDLQLEENTGALAADRAEVRGNLQVAKNRGGVRLVDNRVAQALQCSENRPAPTGGGNVAGEKEGQCRAL